VFLVTKERYGVFRVETVAGPSRRCILDRATMQVKSLRGAGSKFELDQARNDPISKAVKRVEAQGIQEGETRVILLSVLPPARQKQIVGFPASRRLWA
jgi:hypothetical protein